MSESLDQYQNYQQRTEMEKQIRKALEQIVNSFDNDNLQYYKHLSQSLEAILTVLHQEYEAIKQAHASEVSKLQNIILAKQNQIKALQSQKQLKKQARTTRIEPTTPYRILLKSGKKNNTNFNKENQQKEEASLPEEAFSGIHISQKKQYRFSLQIGPSGGNKNNQGSSSSIKNKIVNQRRDKMKQVLSPRPFAHENQLLNYSNSLNNIQQSIKEAWTLRATENLERRNEQNNSIHERIEQSHELDSKRSSIQQKVKLCRKPSNKSKRELLRKKQFSNCETNRIRCVDVTIPIKTINVMAIQPR